MTSDLGFLCWLFGFGGRLLFHRAIVEVGRVEVSIDVRSSCIVSHVYCCFFILKGLYNVKDVLFYLLDML